MDRKQEQEPASGSPSPAPGTRRAAPPGAAPAALRAGEPPRAAPPQPEVPQSETLQSEARQKALAAFSALSNGDRLDLIRLLFPAGECGLAAGEIARQLGLSASRLSFHLSQLEQAGLLRARRAARNVFYAVDPAGLGATISYLLSDCCGAHPEVIACCRQTPPDGLSAEEP